MLGILKSVRWEENLQNSILVTLKGVFNEITVKLVVILSSLIPTSIMLFATLIFSVIISYLIGTRKNAITDADKDLV